MQCCGSNTISSKHEESNYRSKVRALLCAGRGVLDQVENNAILTIAHDHREHITLTLSIGGIS